MDDPDSKRLIYHVTGVLFRHNLSILCIGKKKRPIYTHDVNGPLFLLTDSITKPKKHSSH